MKIVDRFGITLSGKEIMGDDYEKLKELLKQYPVMRNEVKEIISRNGFGVEEAGSVLFLLKEGRFAAKIIL